MTDTSEARQRLFTLRMTEDEGARFNRVAEHYGLTVAGVLRMLMKREDDALGAPARETVKRAAAKGRGR